MSDEQDRMDRARRIRQMREGENDRPEETGPGDDGDGDDESDAGGTDGGDDELEMEWGDPGESTDADVDPDGPDADEATAAGTDSEGGGGTEAGTDAGVGAGTASGTGTDPGDGTETGADSGGISAPLPETDQLESALEGSDAAPETEAVAPDVADGDEESTAEQAETRVLEFSLDGEHYCLDIEYIEEIVKEETVTRVPNTPEFVEGVVDLRGQITTILNPKVTIDKENTAAGELIVVFDEEAFDDQGHVGWVVDDVRQVSLVRESEVNQAPMEQQHVNGVIDRGEGEEFVVWTTPDLVLGEAT
jgi:purine-binding chemotaxis protein CheW